MANPGSAEPQLGTSLPQPAKPTRVQAHRGFYSRGYLPHADFPGLLQTITYRLADSLPAGVMDRISDEARSIPIQEQVLEKRRQIEQWLDAGHGWLRATAGGCGGERG